MKVLRYRIIFGTKEPADVNINTPYYGVYAEGFKSDKDKECFKSHLKTLTGSEVTTISDSDNSLYLATYRGHVSIGDRVRLKAAITKAARECGYIPVVKLIKGRC